MSKPIIKFKGVRYSVNGTKHTLTCTSSDVAHAVFSRPSAITGIESGTPALFEMTSRGGSAEGVWAYNKRGVVILVEEPLDVTAITKVADPSHTESPADYIGSESTCIGIYGTILGITGYDLKMWYEDKSQVGTWNQFSSYEVMLEEPGMLAPTSLATPAQLNASKYKFTVTTSKGTATREVAITY